MKTRDKARDRGRAEQQLRAVPREKLEYRVRCTMREVALLAGIEPSRLRRVVVELGNTPGSAGMDLRWDPALSGDEQGRFDLALENLNASLGGRSILRVES